MVNNCKDIVKKVVGIVKNILSVSNPIDKVILCVGLRDLKCFIMIYIYINLICYEIFDNR